jgi:predicted outer membrane protein
MFARKVVTCALALGLSSLLATAAIAQVQRQLQPNQPQQTQLQNQHSNQMQQQDPAQTRIANKPIMPSTQGAGSADHIFAGCLIVDNQGEVALGKLAEQKAKDNDVKQFAQRMVQDHTQFMQELEKFAGQQGATNESRVGENRTGPETGATTATTDRVPTGSTTQAMGNEHINIVQLKQEIGQKCLEMARQDLDQKQGTEFDKCYIGSQIPMHMEVLATLEVFRNQASPELASVLDKGIQTTKSHLDEAKKIAKSLEK